MSFKSWTTLKSNVQIFCTLVTNNNTNKICRSRERVINVWLSRFDLLTSPKEWIHNSVSVLFGIALKLGSSDKLTLNRKDCRQNHRALSFSFQVEEPFLMSYHSRWSRILEIAWFQCRVHEITHHIWIKDPLTECKPSNLNKTSERTVIEYSGQQVPFKITPCLCRLHGRSISVEWSIIFETDQRT